MAQSTPLSAHIERRDCRCFEWLRRASDTASLRIRWPERHPTPRPPSTANRRRTNSPCRQDRSRGADNSDAPGRGRLRLLAGSSCLERASPRGDDCRADPAREILETAVAALAVPYRSIAAARPRAPDTRGEQAFWRTCVLAAPAAIRRRSLRIPS